MWQPPLKLTKQTIFLPQIWSIAPNPTEKSGVLEHWLAVYGVWTVHSNTRSAKICSQINKKAKAETPECVKRQMWKLLVFIYFFFNVENMEQMDFLAESRQHKGPWHVNPHSSNLSLYLSCPEGHPLHHLRRWDITHHLSNSSLTAKQSGVGVTPWACLSAADERLPLALKESRFCVDEEWNKFRQQAATKQNMKEIIETLYSHNALFQAESVGLF